LVCPFMTTNEIMSLKIIACLLILSVIVSAVSLPSSKTRDVEQDGVKCFMCEQLVKITKEHTQVDKCTSHCTSTWLFANQICKEACDKIALNLKSTQPCADAGFCPLPNKEGTRDFQGFGEKVNDFIRVQQI